MSKEGWDKEEWDKKAAFEKGKWDKASWGAKDKGKDKGKDYAKDKGDISQQWKGAPQTVDSGPPCTDNCASALCDPDATSKAKAYTGTPLKILTLHGGSMNVKGMEHFMSHLVNELGPLVKLVYAQAPKPCRPPKDAEQLDKDVEYIWMGDAQKQSFDPRAPDYWQQDSLPYLRNFIAEHGPFDGIFGYSMGGAGAFSLLAAVPPETFRFAVLCCGYVPTNDPATMAQLEQARPLTVPALHVQGRKDMLTTTGMCDAMVDYFAPGLSEMCKHPEGHHAPMDPRHTNQITAFLLKFV